MVGWLLLGAAAVLGAAVVLTLSRLIQMLRERNKKAVTAKIKQCINNGDYTTVKIGLYNKWHWKVETCEIQADEIDEDEIYKGRVLSLKN